MHAEPAMNGQEDDMQKPETGAGGQEAATRFFGSLMDVLMPAKPPQPKNARIVRQFDVEPAKSDSLPVAVAVAEKRPQREQRSREEARAHRNRSLRAAAGFAD